MDFTSGKLDLDTYMQQAVNSVEVEDTTIRDRIESRRDLLARQDKCSRIQSALCDKIREGKKAIPEHAPHNAPYTSINSPASWIVDAMY